MSDRLFSDMSPIQKLEHCRRHIADGYKQLQAEHGPVHLANILDVWDFWCPYLLARVERLEAVFEAAQLAEREMALLMGDYHAPAYRSMDLVRQIQPMLRVALASAITAPNPDSDGNSRIKEAL